MKVQILKLEDIGYALNTDLIIASTTNGSLNGGYKKLTFNPETGYFKGWLDKPLTEEPAFRTKERRAAIKRYNEL